MFFLHAKAAVDHSLHGFVPAFLSAQLRIKSGVGPEVCNLAKTVESEGWLPYLRVVHAEKLLVEFE